MDKGKSEFGHFHNNYVLHSCHTIILSYCICESSIGLYIFIGVQVSMERFLLHRTNNIHRCVFWKYVDVFAEQVSLQRMCDIIGEEIWMVSGIRLDIDQEGQSFCCITSPHIHALWLLLLCPWCISNIIDRLFYRNILLGHPHIHPLLHRLNPIPHRTWKRQTITNIKHDVHIWSSGIRNDNNNCIMFSEKKNRWNN